MKRVLPFVAVTLLMGCTTQAPTLTPRGAGKSPVGGYVVDYGSSPWDVQTRPAMPALSAELASLQFEGEILVQVVCDPTGKPTQADAINGPAGLGRFASTYVLGWRFIPKVGPRGEYPWAKFQVRVGFGARGAAK